MLLQSTFLDYFHWFEQWRNRAQVPPGATTSNAALSGKKFLVRSKNKSTNSPKFLTPFF